MMRIAFLTSCLEPGRDGVGDYTRLLATECERRGNVTALLSLRDSYCSRERTANALRLRHGIEQTVQIDEASNFLGEFQPDAVSVQFVSYGLHSKGLVGSLVPAFRKIVGDYPVHIFFHEVWIGSEMHARWRDKCVGLLQRKGIFRLLAAADVRAIQTSNPAYQAVLERAGKDAEILPLFGSIPISGKAPNPPDDEYVFVMFGTLHPVWPYEPLLSWLMQLDRPLRIFHVGGMGAGEDIWNEMTKAYSGRITFERRGILSDSEIASIFDRAHFGIATTPWEIIGKSASATAMIEHGLPLVANRDDVHYAGWRQNGYAPQLIKAGPDLAAVLRQAKRMPQASRLPAVCDAFLQTIGRMNPAA